MLEIFEGVVLRAKELMGPMSVKQFALKLGMTQQTVDLYIKGARKPSVEFIYNICCSFNVSADWLLGISQSRDASVVAPNNSGAIASGPNAQATLHAAPAVPSPPSDCARCLLMQEHIRRITGRG